MVALPVIFNPTPQAAAAILADLDDCSLSFDDLAKKHGTTSDALAIWLSTDEIKARIQTSLDSMSLRIRRVATSRLPAALDAVHRIVLSYHRHFTERPLDPAAPDYNTEREHRRRRDESTRRACTLLLRLANFFSPTKPPPRHESRHVPDNCGAGVPPASAACNDLAPTSTRLRPSRPSTEELVHMLDRRGIQHAPQSDDADDARQAAPDSDQPVVTADAPPTSQDPGLRTKDFSRPLSPTYQRPRQRFKRRRQLSG